MSSRPIYLDYQATTPMDRRAFDVMAPFFLERFGNPHATENLHGQSAAEAVSAARVQVADLLGASPQEIVFTSGATEANNLLLRGAAGRLATTGRTHLVTCVSEHKAVLEVFERLRSEGHAVTILSVQQDGRVDLRDLERTLRAETGLVSIMMANNEIGVLQPLYEIGRLCRDRDILLHTDAAQAVGKIAIDVSTLGIDLLSLSGHKLYGPAGVGAAYVGRRAKGRVAPLFAGGGQERGLRPGTVPTALCVGLGAACALARAELLSENARILDLRNALLAKLEAEGLDFEVNGSLSQRIAGNLNVSFADVDAEALLMATRADLALSSGSACTSGSVEPSYVVQALGVGRERAEGAIRIGIGRDTTLAEIDRAASCLAGTVRRLRSLSYNPRRAVGGH